MQSFPTCLCALALLSAFASWSLHAEDKPEEDRPAVNKVFEGRVLAAAKEYESFARVDDGVGWAPVMCTQPTPSSAKFSQSGEECTHGRKLYLLFAKDGPQYLRIDRKDAESPKPVQPGQVIVKESWIPEQVAANSALKYDRQPVVVGNSTPRPDERHETHGVPIPLAKDDDGNLFRCKEKAGLFIMLKLDPSTPETDEGWVYGTVSADGKTVTAAGRMQSCMECHQKAPHDRLFGFSHQKR